MENVRCGQEGPSAARPQITLVALVRFSFFGSTERSHSGLSAAMEKFSKGVNVECGPFATNSVTTLEGLNCIP
jgi:hypothetical protein